MMRRTLEEPLSANKKNGKESPWVFWDRGFTFEEVYTHRDWSKNCVTRGSER